MAVRISVAARLSGAARRLFLWLLVGSFAVAALAPGPGLALRGVSLGRAPLGARSVELTLPSVLLALLLLSAGLGVEVGQLRRLLRRPRVLVGGLLANLAAP